MDDNSEPVVEGYSKLVHMAAGSSNGRNVVKTLYEQHIEKKLKKAEAEMNIDEDMVPNIRLIAAEPAPAGIGGIPPIPSSNENSEDDTDNLYKIVAMMNMKAKRHSIGDPSDVSEYFRTNLRIRLPKVAQGTQTDPCSGPAPSPRPDALMPRNNPLERPSASSASDPSTRDVAVEAPDTAYYNSDQLTFVRIGGFVYRGWRYVTLDGRIHYMPRVPVPIPIDEIRTGKPRRTPA